MSEDLTLRLEIQGRDEASRSVRAVENALVAMAKQAEATGKALAASLGGNLAERFAALKVDAGAFTSELSKGAAKASAAMVELRDSMREVEAAQRRMAKPPKVAVPTVARPDRALADDVTAKVLPAGSPLRPAMAPARDTETADSVMGGNRSSRKGSGATGRPRAQRDPVRDAGRVWSRRQRSEAVERQEIQQTSETWNRAQRRRMALMDRSAAVEARRQRQEVSAAAMKARTEASAADRHVGDIGRAWRLRERSEAAEARHVATMRRERAALRTRAARSGQHALSHARHGISQVNHPVFSSPGFWLHAGAAFGVEAGAHILKASEAFDTSMSRLKMFAPQLDAAEIRKTALADSVSLGVDASKIVDVIAKSVRDGVPPEIAKSLPKSIVQTAQVMGGDIERLTDSLAEGIQESTAMGWIKDQKDSRRFLNIEAGLSTTAGNTPEKTEQFIAAGGLGHGKEMGLDLEKTMAYGAMLNASGSRTGQASARFMGQLSQNTPKMVDKYRQAVGSHKNSEEDRAVRSAPQKLGYGGIREMQSKIMAGPEGLIDFATRLQKLDDKARKLVLEGYGFSEQGGAMLAELGSNGGAKGKAVLARAHELAEQKEADDYLSQKFNEWSKSLAFMLSQIEQGWHAIENEIGDVFKADLVTPFRDWWVQLSTAIVGSNLRDRVHAALMGFIHGLGFDDFRQLLDSMTANVGGFDFTGFAKGLGEGIRATVDTIRPLLSMFGGGAGDAETVGRLAAELLGLSVALHAIGPVVAIVTALSSSLLAIKEVFAGIKALSILGGIGEVAGAAGGIGAAGGAGLIGAAIAAFPLTIAAALAATVLTVTIMNWGEIKDFFVGTGPAKVPEATIPGRNGQPDVVIRNDVLKSVPPAFRDKPETWSRFLSPSEMAKLPAFATGGLISGPGGPTSDSIVARVSAGEFVVNADATRRHFGFLNALNDGNLPAFATGGMVGGGRMNMPSSAGLGGMSSDTGDAVRRATMGTEAGVVAVRGELQGIAALLRIASESDRSTFGHGSELIHGQVKAANFDDASAGDLYRRMQQIANTLKLSAYGISDPDQTSGGGGGFGPGSGRPNLRYGRDGGAARGDTPNMRYGRDGSGRRRGTPGSGEAREIGPKVGLGKMGAKFGAKAPVIMDGLMKKYGLTREQAAGVVGNLGHESAGFTAYHEGGQASGKGGVGWAQWTGPRRRQFEAWTKSRGLNPTSDDASWRYLTEGDPETAGAIAAVKGTNNRKDATRAWHDKFERSADISHGVIVKPKSWNSRLHYADQAFVAQPAGATVEARGDTPSAPGAQPEAVDPDVTKRLLALNQPRALKDEECVTLAMKAVGITKGTGIMGSNVQHWRKGEGADEGNLKPGAAIATFLNRHGGEADSYGAGSPGGGGTRGAHLDHAAVFEKYLTDAAGKKIGMQVAEQFKGSGGIRHRNYMFHNGQYGEGNGSAYHAVKTADGKYLGGPNNPLNVQVAKERGANLGPSPLARTPEGRMPVAAVAAQVPTRERPRPASDGPQADNVSGGGQNVRTADNSTTIHSQIHVHGAGDPHHVARTVVGHLDRMQSRTHDVDAFA